MNRIYFFILLFIHTSLSAQTLLRGNVSDLEASLAKAETLNGDNPRIYLLRGTSLLYTPDQFGGGKKAAKPVIEKALEKFANFKPETALHPTWGQAQVAWMLTQCDQ